jgi:hypothetical protein
VVGQPNSIQAASSAGKYRTIESILREGRALQLVKDHNFLGEIPNITQASLELIKSGAVEAATIVADVLLATAITAFGNKVSNRCGGYAHRSSESNSFECATRHQSTNGHLRDGQPKGGSPNGYGKWLFRIGICVLQSHI